MLAVYLSWSNEPGMGAEGRFSTCLISQDPFLCFAEWEGSLYQIGWIHILFFFQTKILTREECSASKRHPKTRSCRAGIILPVVVFLPAVSSTPSPEAKGPSVQGWRLLPRCSCNRGIYSHLFPIAESSTAL